MKKQATEAQKAAAKERRENVGKLARIIREMTDDQRTAFIQENGAVMTAEGHALSPFNSCMVIMQAQEIGLCPSVVAGFQQWRKAGRIVRKGERGLTIWIPTGTRAQSEGNAQAGAQSQGADETGPRFVSGYVFDISQTEEISDSTEGRGE